MSSRDARWGAPSWFVKSVTIDGENATDIPFDLSTARDDTKIEIVMTDKQTTISGTEEMHVENRSLITPW